MKYYNYFYYCVILLQQYIAFQFILLTSTITTSSVSATDTDTVLPLTTTTVVDVETTTTPLLTVNDNSIVDVPLSSIDDTNHQYPDDSTCIMTIDENGNTIPHPNQPSHCMATTAADAAADQVVVAVPNTNSNTNNYENEDFRLGADIGVIQVIDLTKEDEIIQAIQASREYLMTLEYNNDDNEKCRNANEHCTFWSIVGECESNAHYMHLYCAPACRTCHVVRDIPPGTLLNDDDETTTHSIPEEDDDNDASEEEEDDEEEDDEEEEEVDEATRALNIKRGSDLGIIQSIDDAVYGDRIIEAIAKTRTYMNDIVYVDDKFEKVRALCLNTHESCTYWSLLGECDANPGFMLIHCAPACQTCDQVHVETRCPMDDNSTTGTVFPEKDALNQFYERIIHDPYYQSQYNVTVLSRPTYAEGDSPNDTNLSYAVTGLWVIQFDNIVNDTEAQRLIDLGNAEGYERSADVGEAKPDGTFDSEVNDGRTSTNAWCMTDCMNDPATLNVHERMENITGIPRRNYENLQILQYHENQFYNEHNDFIEYQVDRPCGSRILTFYVYLNTLPEEGGGGTNFPKLNLTVAPKLGRAILWPSILNDHPFEMDPLSNHQALPVLNGYVKYGFNAWIHQRDFQQANHVGCA